jgi:hypothetical protein
VFASRARGEAEASRTVSDLFALRRGSNTLGAQRRLERRPAPPVMLPGAPFQAGSKFAPRVFPFFALGFTMPSPFTVAILPSQPCSRQVHVCSELPCKV